MILEFKLSALGPFLQGFGTILGPMLYGIGSSALCFSQYAYQKELLRGKNRNNAISIGYSNILMSCVLASTLGAASVMLGPAAPFIPLIFACTIAVSILAALSSGGYEKLQKDWGQSGIRVLKWILKFTDSVLRVIPAPIRKILGYALEKTHYNLSKIFLGTHIALLGVIAALISPLIGSVGLSYFALNYLRTQNYLPSKISYGLEKFNVWMHSLPGLFIENTILKIYSYYSIASIFVVKFVLPPVNKFFFGSRNANSSITTPNVSRIISNTKFASLIKLMPTIQAHNDGIDKDLDRTYKQYEAFKFTHPSIKARREQYERFKKLQISPRWLHKAAYYLGVLPMNIAWYCRSIVIYPTLPKQFLKSMHAQSAMLVNAAQIGNVPKIELPDVLQDDASKIFLENFLVTVKREVDKNQGFKDILMVA